MRLSGATSALRSTSLRERVRCSSLVDAFPRPVANERPRALRSALASSRARGNPPSVEGQVGNLADAGQSRANGRYCARDPRLYGCGMGTAVAGPVCGVWVSPVLRRLLRATVRRRVRRGAARSLNVSGREGTGSEGRRNSGGRSERASHYGIMREASPFEHRPGGAPQICGMVRDPRLLFPAKSLPIRAIHWKGALRLSPRHAARSAFACFRPALRRTA